MQIVNRSSAAEMVFGQLPEFRDERQGGFRAVVSGLIASEDFEGAAVANVTHGFPASYIDIGWVRERLEGFWNYHQHLTEAQFSEIATGALFQVAQRVKKVVVDPYGSRAEVQMRTKDDTGWYEYRFSVMLKRNQTLRLV